MSLHTTPTPLSDEIMRLRAELERVNEALRTWQESALAEEARCRAVECDLATVKAALETERELHLEAVQIANDQRGKADRELRRADLLESQVIKREQELERVKSDAKIAAQSHVHDIHALASALEELERVKAQNAKMREALDDIASNFDCDSDAHRYGTTCRVCKAQAALAADAGKESA